jgi:hypothetical protein
MAAAGQAWRRRFVSSRVQMWHSLLTIKNLCAKICTLKSGSAAMLAFVQHAGSNTGRQFPSFVVVPPSTAISRNCRQYSIRVSFQQNPPAARQPAVFAALFCFYTALCTLYFALLELSLIHHHNPCRFGKQPELPQKSAFCGYFFWKGYGLRRTKLHSVFRS